MMSVFTFHKTASLDKRRNINQHLLAREYCTNSSHIRIHRILGTLIIKGSYTFQKTWSKVSKKHIACDGRFAFFDNYENCIDCNNSRKDPYLKFTVQRSRAGKIEDALLMEGYPETLNIPNQGYKGSLFAVVKGNHLLRIDLDSGKVIEEVYLGPSSVRFKKIQWNVAEESFTICSTLTPGMSRHNGRQPQAHPEVIQLIIMPCMPLDFICQLSVSRQVFGRDVAEAAVHLNILMVMHSTNYVRMYSLERILENNRTHRNKLYEKLPDGTQFGVYPSHLTQNVRLEVQPPCLFEVRCRNRDVMITMPPCYYVMWPLRGANGYCCFSFKTHKMIDGGLLQAEECEFEERVSLHEDDSGRIVHMKNSQLRILKLQAEDSSDERRLIEDFVIDFTQRPETSVVRVSQSGRVIKPRVIEDCSHLVDRIVLTMVYCEDQDMILVVSTRDQKGTCNLFDQIVVGFYDNRNGTLLRQFMLEESVSETLERSIFFHLDTIIHILKTNSGRFECHVYKLQPMMDIQDEWELTKRGAVRGDNSQSRKQTEVRCTRLSSVII